MSSLAGLAQADAPPRGTADQLRRQNLARLLTLIHQNGSLSRAELTRRTGLNRSTVGALVADLVALDLAFETMPDSGSRAGRPSPIVNPGRTVVAITVNPEVDAIHIALVALGGRVLRTVHLDVESPLTVAEVVTRSSAAIAGMLSGREPAVRVIGVGLAVPGQVRLSDGQVREATHLGWFEEPMAAMMARATGFPTWAANAAIVGMRAEGVFGAGRGVDDLVYFIGGSSGIGGGVVTGGQWMTGSAGYAGEFGHTFVQSAGTACHCGASGCLEAEVTQRALLEVAGLRHDEADELAVALIGSTDPAAAALVSRDLELLGIAVRNAVNVFNPARVVLGGFLAELYRAGGDRAQSLVGAAIRSARESVTIVPAALGRDQLMIGAGELVFAGLLADPSGALSR
ncbi:ROK family transcriptional regulator [Glaciibacter sp. 2TAF33]|uniref:ROK family transcriptional regulator n=1 Tax=Glaciibacter sp. 2TAF33 TaxID=3233015 RepID=UPI003F8F2F0B